MHRNLALFWCAIDHGKKCFAVFVPGPELSPKMAAPVPPTLKFSFSNDIVKLNSSKFVAKVFKSTETSKGPPEKGQQLQAEQSRLESEVQSRTTYLNTNVYAIHFE